MVQMIMIDAAEYQQRRREQLQDFLARHRFSDVNSPACDSHGSVRFEALSPLQVARQTGNTEMAEILLEAGAKRPHGLKDFGVTLGLRSALSFMSRSSVESQEELKERRPSKSCLKRANSWEIDEDVIQTVLL